LDIKREWGFDFPQEILTTDANQVLDDPDIKIIIELIGGKGIAKKFIEKALSSKKSVVTANKALLAEFGEELFELAASNGADLFYEASVAGGIPIIKALREGLVANPIRSLLGILNGTCNYMLTRMEREGISFDDVLKDAQRLGYAETPPDLGVDGWDTAHKAVLLAQLAFGGKYQVGQMQVKGIRSVSCQDVQYASEFGYRIKLLAILKKTEAGKVEVCVEPTLIPSDHMLAKVDMSFNAVFVKGDIVDETMYYGRGAGRLPTASAVVADVADVARNTVLQPQCRASRKDRNPLRRIGGGAELVSAADLTARAYLRFELQDVAGALAKVTRILADHNISILALTDFMRGKPLPGAVVGAGNLAPVVILTGDAKRLDLDKALEVCLKLPEVGPSYARFRVEAISPS